MPVRNSISNLFSARALLYKVKNFSNWYNIEIAYLKGWQKGTCDQALTIRTRNGLKIRVRNEVDMAIVDDLFRYKVYDQNFARVPPNSVIIDVGAQIGSFSLYAAKVSKAKKNL